MFEYLWLVFPYPSELGCREIAGRIEQMPEAMLSAKICEGSLAIRHRTAIAPYYGVADRDHVFVNRHQAVHLIAYAYGFYIVGVYSTFREHGCGSVLKIAPPIGGALFCPARSQSLDRSLALGKEIGGNTATGGGLHYGCLYRRTPYIISEKIHCQIIYDYYNNTQKIGVPLINEC